MTLKWSGGIQENENVVIALHTVSIESNIIFKISLNLILFDVPGY